MKKGIHPDYVESTVKCACGNEFVVKSNKSEIALETCSKCHPFYTGNQNSASTKGRVEKFNRKYGLNNDSKKAE